MMKYLILAAALSVLAGCSFGKGGDNREIEKRQELENAYKAIQGHYVGKLENLDIAMNVTYLGTFTDKKNENGETIQSVALKVYVELPETLDAPKILDARYYPTTGELLATYMPTKDEPATSFMNIRGYLIGETFNGEYATAAQTSRISNASKTVESQNREGDYNHNAHYYRRLRRHYEKIEGTYEGKLIPFDFKGNTDSIRPSVLRIDVPKASSTVMPFVRVTFTLSENTSPQSVAMEYHPEIKDGNNLTLTIGGGTYVFTGRGENQTMDLDVDTLNGKFHFSSKAKKSSR